MAGPAILAAHSTRLQGKGRSDQHALDSEAPLGPKMSGGGAQPESADREKAAAAAAAAAKFPAGSTNAAGSPSPPPLKPAVIGASPATAFDLRFQVPSVVRRISESRRPVPGLSCRDIAGRHGRERFGRRGGPVGF